MPDQIILPSFEELIESSEEAVLSADRWEYIEEEEISDEKEENEKVAA